MGLLSDPGYKISEVFQMGLPQIAYNWFIRRPQYQEEYDWWIQKSEEQRQAGETEITRMQNASEAGFENLGIQSQSDWQNLINATNLAAGELRQNVGESYTDMGKWLGGEIERLGEETGTAWETFTTGVTGRAEARAEQLKEDYGHRTMELMGMWETGAEGIEGGYRELRNEAMGLVGTLGQQAQADITRRFELSGAEQQAALAERGLGSTTLLSDAMRANVMEESAEQRRLSDMLTGQRLGVLSEFGQAELLAQERLLGAGAGLYAGVTGEALAAQERGGYFLTELETELGVGKLEAQQRWEEAGLAGGLSIRAAETEAMAGLGQWQTNLVTGLGAQQIQSRQAIGLGQLQADRDISASHLNWLANTQYERPIF